MSVQPTDGRPHTESASRPWQPIKHLNGAARHVARRIPKPAPRSLCLECMSRICRHFAMAPDRLTPRESEILLLLAGGLSNKEIAGQMRPVLTEGTVKVYMSRLFTKLGLSSRLEAALWVLANREAIQ